MTAKKVAELHPSVQEFKEFVKKHPKIIYEVRNEKKTWQQLYQDWYLLGEADEVWDPYKSEEELQVKEENSEKANSKVLSKVMSFFQNINPEQMQGQVNNLQNIASNIQELINIFRGNPNDNNHITTEKPPQNPFLFQKD